MLLEDKISMKHLLIKSQCSYFIMLESSFKLYLPLLLFRVLSVGERISRRIDCSCVKWAGELLMKSANKIESLESQCYLKTSSGSICITNPPDSSVDYIMR